MRQNNSNLEPDWMCQTKPTRSPLKRRYREQNSLNIYIFQFLHQRARSPAGATLAARGAFLRDRKLVTIVNNGPYPREVRIDAVVVIVVDANTIPQCPGRIGTVKMILKTNAKRP